MEHFKALLQANQLKSTHQRLAILEAIERFGHIDIDTLYTTIRKSIRPCPKLRFIEISMI